MQQTKPGKTRERTGEKTLDKAEKNMTQHQTRSKSYHLKGKQKETT